MTIETLKTKLAALDQKAGDCSMGSFFPMPDFTPKKQEALALKLGGEAMAIVAEAEAAGETGIAKMALDIAQNMKSVVERAREEQSA